MAEPLVGAVRAYARATLPDLLALGPVAAPLAPWLLAALVAPATRGGDREALEAALGLRADEAAAAAGTVLAAGPRSLRTALACWRATVLATDGALGAWERSLPGDRTGGPIPTTAEADAWTAERTLGLIERFPVALTSDTLAVLAVAMATRVSWDVPLPVAPAAPNAWGVRGMLVADGAGVHATSAGLVASAVAGSWEHRLEVRSFIGPPAASPAQVVAGAFEILDGWSAGGRSTWVPPQDLPPEGDAWSVDLRPGFGAEGRALVPAFAEVTDAVPIDGIAGMGAACGAYGRLVEAAAPPAMRPVAVEAAMSAVARYDRRGFEAAAVAAMAAARGAPGEPDPIVNVRFPRPHLVLALATDDRFRGLPLFAAWVDAGVREPEA